MGAWSPTPWTPRDTPETPGESFGTDGPRLGGLPRALLPLPSRLGPCLRAAPWVLAHTLEEHLAKAEGCWKAACFVGRCLVCPLKVKLGTPGRCLGESGQELPLLWDLGW